MRTRLAIMVVPLAAAAVMLPATPAAAKSCSAEPRLDYAVCVVKSSPYWELCVMLGVCQ